MTISTARTGTGSEASFVEQLRNLDAGEKARLKRNAGRTVAESRSVTGLFYRIVPYNVPERQHDTYFLVATLYPLAESGGDRNLGETLQRIRSTGNAAALDRRVNVLLDADAGQLPFRLRQMIRLIDSNRRGVNWEQLLTDLLNWNRDDRRVQKRWAMSYYSRSGRTDQQEEGTEPANA